MSAFKDLTGQKFERLTVLERVPNYRNRVAWRCICECGNETIVTSLDICSGNTKSCGCLQRERSSEAAKRTNYIHGETRTPLHNSWSAMLQRCNDPNYKWYKDYGNRGIKVCEEWLTFVNFRDWALSNGYQKGLTIERIDVNGNYTPDNCKWITNKEQQRNKRNNHFVEYCGRRVTIAELSEMTGIPYHRLYSRIQNSGWSVEKAVNTPLQNVKHK